MMTITNKRFLKLHEKLGKKHHNDTLNEMLDVYESAIDLVKTYRGHKKDMKNIFSVSQENEKN